MPPRKPFGYGPRPPTGSITIRRFFKPTISDLIRSGAKLQTLLDPQWLTPKPGDRIILLTWVGRSARTLRRATITSVTPITLPNPGIDTPYSPPSPEIDDAFARAEGYNNLKHLLIHFKPGFRGVLIRWEPLHVTQDVAP